MRRPGPTKRPTHRLLVGIVTLSVVGCVDGDAPPPTDQDDGVVRQVIDPSQRLALEAEWSVGQADDPMGLQLFRVWGGAVTETGETFVLEDGNSRIDVFDDDGVLLRQFGGKGDGPGEFQRATYFDVRRDTVLVKDEQRFHFFGTDGTLFATHQLRFPGTEFAYLAAAGSTDSGWWAAVSISTMSAESRLPPIAGMQVFNLDPVTGDLEPTGFDWESVSTGEWSGNFFIRPILAATWAGDFDGLGRFITANTEHYHIDVHGLDGAFQFRIENEAQPSPLDDAVVEMWKESRSCDGSHGGEGECSRDEVALSLPRTENRRFIGRIRAYPSGHFSVLRDDLDPNPFDSESTRHYDHFGPEGRFLGATSDLTPLWFDGATLLSLERDDLGVESVVRYRVGG